MPVATNIDDVIAYAATDIAALAYGGVKALYTQMGLWNVGMFSTPAAPTGGIFPPNADATAVLPEGGQRLVTDWFAQSVLAKNAIEGTGVSSAGVVGTSACIDAVTRVAYAVKYARAAGVISAAQQTAVVTLFNTVWT